MFASTMLCFLALFAFHYGLIEILERPARKAGSIVGLEGKEMLRLRLVSLIPAFLLLPTAFASFVLSFGNTLAVLGLCFLGVWLYQILHIPAILKVEKIGKKSKDATVASFGCNIDVFLGWYFHGTPVTLSLPLGMCLLAPQHLTDSL